jgi:hypothetical protein
MKWIDLIAKKAAELRKTLNTNSLRDWMRNEFPMRTGVALRHIPSVFYRAYTIEPTYTVRIFNHDSGTIEEQDLTELQIRDRFGDLAWEESLRQFADNNDGNAYVDLNDFDNLWGEPPDGDWEAVMWGDWHGTADAED